MIKENSRVALWRKGISYMLVCAMIYVLIFSGLNIDDFLLGLGKVKHIGIIEQGDDYIIYENNDGSRTLETSVEVTPEYNTYFSKISQIKSPDSSCKYISENDSIDTSFPNTLYDVNNGISIKLPNYNIKYTPIVCSETECTPAVLTKAVQNETIDALLYEDVFGENIDVEYVTFIEGVKENIILNEKPDIYEYNYMLDTDGAKAEIIDNQIILTDDTGAEILFINAPYMSDAVGEYSTDISLGLEETDDGYIMTVCPEKEWLCSEDRVYPIIVDPTYTTKYFLCSVSNAYFWRDGYVVGRGVSFTVEPNFVGDLANEYVDIQSARFYGNTKGTYDASEHGPFGVWSRYTGEVYQVSSASIQLYEGRSFSFNLGATGYSECYIDEIFKDGKYVGSTDDIGFDVGYNTDGTFSVRIDPASMSVRVTYFVLEEVPAPTATVHSNGVNSESGYIDLTWNAVSGATKYNICFFNGDEYQTVDTVTSTSWSSKGKNIWPTAQQINAGNYTLYSDGGGGPLTQFANDLYKNVTSSDGADYSNDPRYFVKIVPQDDNDFITRPSLCDAAAVYLPDASAPYAPISVGANPAGYTNAGTIDITWSSIQDYNGTNFADMTSGTIRYSIDSANNWQNASNVDFANHKFTLDVSSLNSGKHIVYIRAKDSAGNENQKLVTQNNNSISSVSIYIDNKGPVINSIKLPSSWTNENPVQIDYSASDTNGISYLDYNLDNSGWIRLSTTKLSDTDFPLTSPTSTDIFTDGEHQIRFRAVDSLGNVGNETEQYKLWIDRAKPVIGSFSSDAENWTNVAERNNEITLSYSGVTDIPSGVETLEYSENNVNWHNIADVTSSSQIISSLTSDFINTLYYLRAIDFAGNVSDIATARVRIDNTNPTISTFTSNAVSWTNTDDMILSWTGLNDTGSGIDKLEISQDMSVWNDVDKTKSNFTQDVSGEDFVNTVYYIRATDYAGNTSNILNTNVKIDRVSPTISTFTSNAANWTNTDTVNLYWTGLTDIGSGINTLEMSSDNTIYAPIDKTANVHTMDFSSLADGEYTYYIKAADYAGNTSPIKNTIVKIDRTDPVTSINSPADGTMANGVIDIWATVDDTNIHEYSMIIKRYDSSYNLIETIDTILGNTNRINELFDSLDIEYCNQGDIIVISLTCSDLAGNASSDEVTIYVEKSVAEMNSTLTLTGPAEGSTIDTVTEQVEYERDLAALGNLTYINYLVDGILVSRTDYTEQIDFESLLYDENTTHSLALVGENDLGAMEHISGVVEYSKLHSENIQEDTESSSNIQFVGGNAQIASGENSGHIVFDSIALSSNDLTYKVNLSSILLQNTSIKCMISVDGGMYTEIDLDKEYLLNGTEKQLQLKVVLNGTTTNNPLLEEVKIDVASVQNPYYVKVKHVEDITGLKIVSNEIGQIAIKWDKKTDTDVRYDVYRGKTSDFIPNANYMVSQQQSGNEYIDTDVVQGNTYYYKVTATKTYNVTSPYIGFRESKAAQITATAFVVNDTALTINHPSNGEKIQTHLKEIEYSRQLNAQGSLEKINYFVDDAFVLCTDADKVLNFESLLYKEKSTHSIVLVGENSAGGLEYSGQISTTKNNLTIDSSENVDVSSIPRLLSGQTQGQIIYTPVALEENALSYTLQMKRTMELGTDIECYISTDGGSTYDKIIIGKGYIVKDSEELIVKVILKGTGTNSPTIDDIYLETVKSDSNHSVYVQLVDNITNLQVANNSLNRIVIEWDKSEDTDVRYNVYRSNFKGFQANDDSIVAKEITSCFYTDMDVAQGETYYYKVIAVKTYNVNSPYIGHRVSDEADISVTAYTRPSEAEVEGTTYTYSGDDGADTFWGDPEEIEQAEQVNNIYGSNWTVNNAAEAPAGSFEVTQSLLNGRAYCSYGFEPINFVSGNFYIKSLDATYQSAPEVNSSILRTYNTQTTEKNGPFGNGWAWHYSTHLKLYSDGHIGMTMDDGHLAMFRLQSDGTYLDDADEQMSLIRNETEHIVTTHEGEVYTFDSGGQLKSYTAANGNKAEIIYQDNGLIDKVVHEDGSEIKLILDDKGHITNIYLPTGEVLSYEYDGNNLVKFTDEAGQTTSYVYDSNGRMTEWYDKNGIRQVYNVYDDSDRVVEQWDANGGHYYLEYGDNSTFTTDANGNKNEYYYDDLGRTTKIIDSKGESQMFEYNNDSQVTKYTDQLGMSISYDYDTAGNLIRETKNDGRTREYQYDGNNNLTAEKDYNGNWTQYHYDSNNNMIQKVFPDGSTYKYEYTSSNQLRKITDPLGNTDRYEYDGNNMESHTDANGSTTEYKYDEEDNLIEITDALGNVIKMEYNDKGNITRTIMPDNTYMSYEYDNMDNMVVFYDAKNQATQFEYNALGKVVKTTNPDGSIITYEYDYNQNLIKTNYPDGTYTINTYDGNNNLISTVDQDGRKVTMQYNAVNDITGIVSPNDATSELHYNTNNGLLYKTVDKGVETEYHYDSNENVTKLIYTDGTTTEYEYDSMNRVVKETLNNGAATRYVYNAIGLVDTVIDPMGNETKYVYDKIGQLTKIIDSIGNVTRYKYDAVGNMISMQDAKGNSVEYSYDAVSQLQSIITPLGSMESYNYDPNGQIENIINALGASASNTYDEMGRVTESTDLLGNTTTYEYDIAGNMVKETNSANNSFTYEYDNNGNVIKITDPLGSNATYEYDVMNNITEVNGEEGYKEEYTYDEYNRLIKTLDSEGYEKHYEYDEMGKLIKEYDNTDKSVTYDYNSVGQVNGITNGENETTKIYYDLNGNTTQVLYADGTNEYFHYDELNRLIRQYDRVGLETLYEYDSVGNVTRIKQPGNKISTYEYDKDNNLVKEVNAEGGVTRYEYDKAYNVVSVTDPMGNTTTMEYNAASMLTKVIDPMENISVAVEYNILGEVVSETDALGNVTSYSYDAVSRLTGVTDALGRTTEYTYDRADNIIAVLDGNGNTTQYEYNTTGLLTKEVDALGNEEKYEYLVDGLIKEITKADGTSSVYSYDKAGRMLDIIYSDGTTIDYGYNEIGSVTTMTDSLGTTTYQYDNMQRLISTTDVNDKTISYEYDILGRKTSQTLPDGQTTEYTYDVMDRLTEVYQNDELLAEYDYNKNSQLIENNRNELKTTYEYDALGQLTELTTQKGYEDIMNFTYEYDKIGNITSEVRTESDTVNERSYLYDSANQLIGFTDNDYSESYTYDNAGNMLTKSINDTITSYSYNEANQLVEETLNGKTIGYTYNVNGDLVQKSTGEEYSYDIQGNLTSIIGNGIDQSFTYNGNGHRMSKTDDGETIYYVNDINLTYEQVLQTYDDSGNVLNTYTYGIERIQSQGVDNETYLYDGRGSVVGTISSEDILTSYSYTAYGDLMPTSPQPSTFGYNGEQCDSDTGLIYLRARYYSPDNSRFISEDIWRGDYTEPVSLNRYAYVYNDPVNYVDISGYARARVSSNDGKKQTSVAARKQAEAMKRVQERVKADKKRVENQLKYQKSNSKSSNNNNNNNPTPTTSGGNQTNTPSGDDDSACSGKWWEKKPDWLNGKTVGGAILTGVGITVAVVAVGALIAISGGVAAAPLIAGISMTLGTTTAVSTTIAGIGASSVFAAGVFTAGYGLSDAGEGITGKNLIREEVYNGDAEKYDNAKMGFAMYGTMGASYLAPYAQAGYSSLKNTENATKKDIVGTKFNEVKPTQEYINQEKVTEYENKLKSGEYVQPIEIVDIPNKGKYLIEGHHRYVASQKTGIPVDSIITQGEGPVGFSNWSYVQWKEYISEDQFWGD